MTWYRPASLEELLELKEKHPQAKLVIGNTEVGKGCFSPPNIIIIYKSIFPKFPIVPIICTLSQVIWLSKMLTVLFSYGF